jgi:hypothetical protein
MNMNHDEVDFELKRLQDLCREKSAIIRRKMDLIEQQAATIARLNSRISMAMIESERLCCSACAVNKIIQDRLNNVE